ncbi:hypothetical protein ABC382_01030 [Lysinibacillus sp. 1P01SD]|uniref:hypothetical protein n=1 Tax=Lysinibacillus sp. 1P01SD TaxID=3132285 RepID=UPI0039A05FD9
MHYNNSYYNDQPIPQHQGQQQGQHFQQEYYNQNPNANNIQPQQQQQQQKERKIYEHIPQTLTEAEILAQQIERMEVIVKQAKANLRAFMEANEGIEISGGTHSWTLGDNVSWEFTGQNLEQLAKIMAIEGINPYEMMTINSTAKKVDWIAGLLPQFANAKITKRIKSAKKRG